MRILIAPDKFKGTLSGREVGEAIATGLHEVLPDAKVDILPMADGGEGTADVIGEALGGLKVNCKAHDPIGREIEAHYARLEPQRLAVMEMSEAAGMRRLQPNELNPGIATTFGVGEMMLDATKRGAEEIIIGLGGSATNDGGFGMARALGFRFLNPDRKEVENLVDLVSLQKILPSPRSYLLGRGSREAAGESDLLPKMVIAAVDVRNPLLGENGATRVFGPQKGVTPDKIEKFERALTRLADVVTEQFGFDYRNEVGAGAAGGLGFGLMSFCAAKISPGFDQVAKAVGLERKVSTADIVITGEGSLDRQTLEGKTPAGVAQLARRHHKPVFAFVGRATDDPQVRELFDGIYTNARPGMSTEENMKRAAEFLQENARQLARAL
ncbi:MAG TPA: glycerate kinase [Chthoniobacterales bacterium]|nr:glycerate kinase [Chthoniobacterales bacterium]